MLRPRDLTKRIVKDHVAETLELQEGEEATNAYQEIQEKQDIRPLNALVTPDIALAVKKYVDTFPGNRFGPKGRVLVWNVITWMIDPANMGKGQIHMIADLRKVGVNLNPSHIYRIERNWPHFFKFVNVLMQKVLLDSQHKVDAATLHHAVNGTERDRRLFYELVGRLRKDSKPAEGSGPTFVFINDSLVRPELSPGQVIDVQGVDEEDTGGEG